MLNITEVLNATKRDGGGTFHLTRGKVPTVGCLVGGNPECPEKRVPHWEDRHGPVLHALVEDYVNRAEESGGWYLGTWVDGDTLVLDSPDRLHTLSGALALAKRRGETAIYDLSTGEVISV